MHRTVRCSLLALSFALTVGGAAGAQRRPEPTVATRAGSSSGAQQDPSPRSPNFTALAGIATGDNGVDLGFALAATITFRTPTLPFDIRVDPFFSRHGAGDTNLNIFGVSGNAQYVFPTTASASPITPYVFGGIGLFHSSVSDIDDSGSTDPSLSLGGGIRFARRFVAEARLYNIDGFTTIPVLLGYRF